jgi:hypothetical protein
MGCKSVTLDLRFNTVMNIRADKDIPANAENMVKFSDIPNLAGGHTLVMGDQTYTVGNGLEIVGDDILWTYTRGQFTTKVVGKLENNATSYYRIKITLWLQ